MHVTRFFGLASVVSKGKDKSLYAANIQPLTAMSYQDLHNFPADMTNCPYSHSQSVLRSRFGSSAITIACD